MSEKSLLEQLAETAPFQIGAIAAAAELDKLRARIAELENALTLLLLMEDRAREVGIAAAQKGSPNWKKWEAARAVLKHGEKA